MLELTATLLQVEEEISPEMMIASLVIGLLIAAGAGYWVYRDASNRQNNELLWALGIGFLLFLFLPVGLVAIVAYLLLRGDVTESTDEHGGDWDADSGADDRGRDTETDDWGSPDEGATNSWDSSTDDADDWGSSRDEQDDRDW
ncbi:TMEM14 family protein [Natronolimnohabitans innermongolicus]|uniref:Uncharacterized protein n=1 Tax=Natronolimnohabitans innermongolicus JCM 12255 TaxID=1227499 RepID=L9X047_9EURY|nr:TMEM14 family protein [Natronolimnohabitans innermongolicus]ELY55119.1 hypothetical protein C493_11572 [Natronolimnohabitans innermongolicus JCM 12255]